MKKTLYLVALACVIALAGCTDTQSSSEVESLPTSSEVAPVAPVEEKIAVSLIIDDETVELSAEDSEIISEILKGEWEQTPSNCYNNATIVTDKDKEIKYHSECGNFNDVESGKSILATEEQKNIINNILGNYNSDVMVNPVTPTEPINPTEPTPATTPTPEPTAEDIEIMKSTNLIDFLVANLSHNQYTEAHYAEGMTAVIIKTPDQEAVQKIIDGYNGELPKVIFKETPYTKETLDKALTAVRKILNDNDVMYTGLMSGNDDGYIEIVVEEIIPQLQEFLDSDPLGKCVKVEVIDEIPINPAT